jgi:YbbR domain-containing protein
MPFREINRFTRPPGTARSTIRRILFEDWSLKLLALAITLVLWFMVSGREIEREIVVEPQTEGKPAPSYEVKEVIATPSHVRVTGPASHVNALQKAFTEKISIEGRRDSFDSPRTPIHISDPKVDVLDTVNVHITIVTVENSNSRPRETN